VTRLVVIQPYRLPNQSTTGLRVVDKVGDVVDKIVAVDYQTPDLRAAAETYSAIYGVPWVCTVEVNA
jgi:hypothetical protein